MTTFQDETRRCASCGDAYVWTVRDQRFSHERGYFPPKRCPKCREWLKRHRRERDAAMTGE